MDDREKTKEYLTRELNQLRERLAESEEKLRSVVSQARDGISIVDEHGVVTEWNQAMQEITGLERQDVVGKLVWDVQFQLVDEAQRTPETYARLETGLRELLKTGQAPWMDRTMEREYMHPNGSQVYLEGMVYAVQTHKGFTLVSVSRDITERRQAEHALRESEERFARFMDNLPGVAFIKDTAGRHLFVNRGFEDLFELSRDEWYGKTNEELFPSEIAESFTQVDRLVLSTGMPVQAEEQTEAADWLSYKFPIGSSAPFDMLGGIAIDITERKLAEGALREGEERYRTLVENAPLCIHEMDLDGCLLSMNRAGLRMVGVESAQDVIGRQYLSFVSEQDGERVARLLREAVDGKSSEFEFLSASEAYQVLKSSFVPLRDSDGSVVRLMGITEDITERVRAAEAQRLNESRLQVLVELGQMTETSLPQIADYVLAEAVKLTRSEIGFIGFMDAGETVMNIHAWSEEAMAGCAVADAPLHFPIDEAGIWGEAVRQHKPVIVNDYAAPSPHKRGYPNGHVSLARLLTVPVFERDRIVAVVAVGNKESEYDESDVHQLTLLTDGMWKLIQRRQMGDALRESEERYRTLVNSSADHIFMLGAENAYLASNDRVDHFGLERGEQLVGRHMRDVYSPDLANQYEQQLLTVRSTGKAVDFEHVIQTSDGIHYHLDTLYPIFRDGEVSAVGGICRDITERKHAEEALRESEERFRSVYSQSPIAIELYDPEGHLVDANAACLDMFGVADVKAVKGFKLFEDPNVPKDAKQRLQAGQAVEYQSEFDFELVREMDLYETTKSGRRYLDCLITPWAPGADTAGGFLVHVWDVTESREAEEALRRSEGRLRQAAHLVRLGIWDWEVATDEAVWSEEMFPMYGIDPAEFTGKGEDYFGFTLPDDRQMQRDNIRRAFERAAEVYAETGQTSRIDPDPKEFRILRPDGTICHVTGDAVAIVDNEGHPLRMLGVLQDITERKQAEEMLRCSLAETARGQRLLLALSQAAQAVQRARTANEVYHTVGDEIASLGYNSTIFAVSEDRSRLELAHMATDSALARAAEKLTGLSAQGYGFPLQPGGFYQRLVADGQTLFMESIAEPVAEALPQAVRPLASRLAVVLGTEKAIYAPLVVSGEAFALLTVIGAGLTESDVPAITAFANQAAIAIENARLYESLNQQQEDLRALAARLAAVEEAERQRLVRELHDQVGQNLTALGINLNIVQAQSQGAATDLVRSRLSDSLALVEQTTARIRSLMADLRPPVLDDYGLVAALHWLGEQTASRADIAVQVHGEELRPRLAEAVETALFRVAQEALTNVVKHARAAQATVTVKEDDGLVRMAIRDDGIGFDPARPPGTGEHWGLLIMRERADAVGGLCHVASHPGQGTHVIVEVQR